MAGAGADEDIQQRGFAAEAHGADAEGVGGIEHLALQGGQLRLYIDGDLFKAILVFPVAE